MKDLHHKKSTATVFCLLALIALTRLFGLLRTLLLARIFGIGTQGVAYELAATLTATLYDTTFGALIACIFLPAYLARRENEGLASADAFAFGLMPRLFLAVLLLFAPLFVFPYRTLSFVLPNISEQTAKSAILSIALLSVARGVLSLSSLLVGILQTDRKPLLPATVYALSSFLSLGLIALFRRHISASAVSLILLLVDIATFITLFLLLRLRHPRTERKTSLGISLKKQFKKACGVILFSSYLPITAMLTSLFAAGVTFENALAVNGYASKIPLLSASLLFAAFHGVYYPKLARLSVTNEKEFPKSNRLFVLLALAASGALFLLAPFLLTLLYGAQTDNNVALLTVSMMRLYALSVFPLTMASIYQDMAYLAGKTKALGAITLTLLFLFVCLFFLLKPLFGIYAAPLSFLIAAFGRAFLLHRLVFGMRPRLSDGKIRLMLVLTDANVGGAGRQLLTYLAHSDRTKFDLLVALPFGARLADMVTSLNVPVVYCGKEASFSLSTLFSYYRMIRRHRPHILHANASLSARIAAFLAGVPIRVYTRHCVYPLAPCFRYRISRLLVGCATNLLSTSVIAVADKAAENLYGMGIAERRVTVIENGVDPILPNHDARASIRRQWQIHDNETLAVICTRLEKDKGVHILIEAAALLCQAGQPIRFFIVGTGSEEDALRKTAHTLGVTECVHFCGFVSDVSPYLNAADLYVNCSLGTEATSLAIAEAMSLGLAIIATDYGGNTAMVKDGTNGILIPQNHPAALADALTIMTDPALRRRFGNASREIYASRFSADRMARANEALYKNLFLSKGYPLP